MTSQVTKNESEEHGDFVTRATREVIRQLTEAGFKYKSPIEIKVGETIKFDKRRLAMRSWYK